MDIALWLGMKSMDFKNIEIIGGCHSELITMGDFAEQYNHTALNSYMYNMSIYNS